MPVSKFRLTNLKHDLRHVHSPFVDDGIDLETVGVPFVVLHRNLTALALHLVTAVAVFLVNADHDVRRIVPADSRREHCTKSIIADAFGLAHATAVVNDDCSHLLFGLVGSVNRRLTKYPPKMLLKMSGRHGLWLRRCRVGVGAVVLPDNKTLVKQFPLRITMSRETLCWNKTSAQRKRSKRCFLPNNCAFKTSR